jgi:Ca-activated chloride channel family protein
MKFVSRRVFAAAVAAAAASVVAVSARQEPIRSGAKTVAVYATVADAQGRLVPDLARDDFQILDNGKPQPLTVFSSDVQPITVVMMLDRSGSMEGNFGLVEAAGEAFVRRLGSADKARIGSFAARIQVDPQDFTSDQNEMIRILRTELQEAGPTPLWNAVNVAITDLLHQEGRRVVLVFTDGDDNPMNFKLNNASVMDIMDRAERENVMIYAVGLQSTGPRGGGFQPPFGRRGGFGGGGFGAGMRSEGPDPALPKVAGETGGGYFELTRAEDLASTFERVADELHRQYALGFDPAKLDDKMHKLEVKLDKGGMKVRARKSYLASKQ